MNKICTCTVGLNYETRPTTFLWCCDRRERTCTVPISFAEGVKPLPYDKSSLRETQQRGDQKSRTLANITLIKVDFRCQVEKRILFEHDDLTYDSNNKNDSEVQ